MCNIMYEEKKRKRKKEKRKKKLLKRKKKKSKGSRVAKTILKKQNKVRRAAPAWKHERGQRTGGGTRGEPTEPPRAAQGTARHSATGRAGRTLTTGHLRVSRRDKPPICLLAPPFTGEATE